MNLSTIGENFVGRMVKNQTIEESEREEYIYAFICMAESGISIGTILVISVLMDDLIPTLFFLGVFLSLRKRTGGFHFDSFWKCYVGTIGVYMLSVGICRQSVDLWFLLTDVFLAMLLILWKGTVNHPNMNYNRKELLAARRTARKYAVVETLGLFVVAYMGMPAKLIRHMAMGIILCAILLCLSIITGQEVEKNG